jgi:bifunctional non-homologous end joining protein LigD
MATFNNFELDGEDLRHEPIEVRKAQLARLLPHSAVGLAFNEHIDDEDAGRVFEHACGLGLEGIVSKRKGSPVSVGTVLALAEDEEAERAGRPPRGDGRLE